jgi:hypothetical protein
LKPALSNAEVTRPKPESVNRQKPDVYENTQKLTGISKSQKKSFLPILSNKLSSGIATNEGEPA